MEPASTDRAQAVLQELSGDLMSPYCPGRTIASCPSGKARELEDEILAKAREGQTREEIESDLVARFGPQIVGYRPPPYLLGGTVVVGLLALVFLVYLARQWAARARRSREAAATGPNGAAPPTRRELEALEDALDEEDRF